MPKNNEKEKSQLQTIQQRLSRFEEISLQTIKSSVLGERQASDALQVLHTVISRTNLNPRNSRLLLKILDKESVCQRIDCLLRGKEGDKSCLSVAKLVKICPNIVSNKTIDFIFKLLAKQISDNNFVQCENWMIFLYVLSCNSWSSQILQCMDKYGQLNSSQLLSEELLKQFPTEMIKICANVARITSRFQVLVRNCFLWMQKIRKALLSDPKNFESLNLFGWFLQNLGSNFWIENPQIFSEFFSILLPCINFSDGCNETNDHQIKNLNLLLKAYQKFFIQFPMYLQQKTNFSQQFEIFEMFVKYSKIKEISKIALQNKINIYYGIFINILKVFYVFQVSEGFGARTNPPKQNQIEIILEVAEIFLKCDNFQEILYYLSRISNFQMPEIQSKIQTTIRKFNKNIESPFVHFLINCDSTDSSNNKNSLKKAAKINWYTQICGFLEKLFFMDNFYSVSIENLEQFLFSFQPHVNSDLENKEESVLNQLSDEIQQINLSYFRTKNEEIFSVEVFELLSVLHFLQLSLFHKLVGLGFSLENQKIFVSNDVCFQINDNNDSNNIDLSQNKEQFLFGNSSLLSLRLRALQRQLAEALENDIQILKIKSGVSLDGIQSVFEFIQFGSAEISNQVSVMRAQKSMGFSNSFCKIPSPQEFIHYLLLNFNIIPIQGWLVQNHFSFDMHALTSVDKYNLNISNACIQNNDENPHKLLQLPQDQFKVLEWESEWGSPYDKKLNFNQKGILFAACYGEHAIVVPIDAEYAQHVCPYVQGLVSFNSYTEQNCCLRVFQPGFVDAQTMFTYLLYLYTRRVFLGLDIFEIEQTPNKKKLQIKVLKYQQCDVKHPEKQYKEKNQKCIQMQSNVQQEKRFLSQQQPHQHIEEVSTLQNFDDSILDSQKFQTQQQQQQKTSSSQQSPPNQFSWNEQQVEKRRQQQQQEQKNQPQPQKISSKSDAQQNRRIQAQLQQQQCNVPSRVRFCIQENSISCCGKIRQLIKLMHTAQLMLDEDLLQNLNSVFLEAEDALTLDLIEVQGLLVDHLGKRIYKDQSVVSEMRDCLPEGIWEIIKEKVIACRRNIQDVDLEWG